MNPVNLDALFGVGSPHVVGMVHLLSLPGAPGWSGSMTEVVDRACADAITLEEGGVSGVMVENYGDLPFRADHVGPETVAALTRAVTEVVRVTSIPVGVNVLRNDGMAAVSIATATGARFVRVNVLSGVMATDQGWIRGRAAEVMRLRATLRSDVAVLGDVFVKHATPPAGLTLEDAADDLWSRAGADGLIVSGRGTGKETSIRDLESVQSAAPGAPVWVGSGATTETLPGLLEHASGIIVGSAIQQDGTAGRPIDKARLDRFMDVVRSTPRH